MEQSERKPAILLLEDGTIFHGEAAGALGTTSGEIAFNTGMTGYQEIFTDPSYYGQILVMAAAHIGNYGVHESEVESKGIKIAGMVCKKFSENYSRPGASSSLQAYFEYHQKVAICEVDTRSLIRHIRDKGAMNAIISSELLDVEQLKVELAKVPRMDGLELSSKVSAKEAVSFGSENVPFRVAVIDLGTKNHIVDILADKGLNIKIFPMGADFEEIKKWQPNGYMISNGPGDPSVMSKTIHLVGQLIETGKPIFGICLGHQIIALSQGLKTKKMFNGHRGINHPVMNLKSGKAEITSQNHGFEVDKSSLEGHANIEVSHSHMNDGSIAGIRLKDRPVFSVQYHPEASPGPHDSRYLFDQFLDLLQKSHSNLIN